MAPSAHAMRVFRYYKELFKLERPLVYEHHSDDQALRIDILETPDLPLQGLMTFGTIGLSIFPNTFEGGDVRVELLLAALPSVTYASNVLSTAAFDVMRGPFTGAWPGSIKPTAISRNTTESRMKDVMFISPFWWKGLDEVHGTHFLQVIPVHDEETAFALEHGSDALESLFEEAQMDMFDWHRDPVV